MKFICSFEVDCDDIGFAKEFAGDLLKYYHLAMLEHKMDMTSKDKNDPGIPYIDNWIEEYKEIIKTVDVKEKD
jgi:hypothetical protein